MTLPGSQWHSIAYGFLRHKLTMLLLYIGLPLPFLFAQKVVAMYDIQQGTNHHWYTQDDYDRGTKVAFDIGRFF